jgi:hypothetical protein
MLGVIIVLLVVAVVALFLTVALSVEDGKASGAFVVGLVLIAVAVLAGHCWGRGSSRLHDDVPTGVTMEVKAVVQQGTSTQVVMRPWGSNDEPTLWWLHCEVPADVKCLVAKNDKDPKNYHAIRFVECPSDYHSKSAP